MRLARTSLAVALALAAFPAASQTGWEPVEKVEPYSISGSTAPELYGSIGERGPEIGIGRTVAFTNFKLTWRRDYRPEPDGACTLVSAKPKLIISYVLPEPSQELAEPVATNWKTFIDGVASHERVHGQFIIEMVEAIVTYSVGLSVPDDPNCKKIRTTLTERLAQLSQMQRQRGRDFDRVEMTEGGAVHQLILNFVNGG